MRVSSLPPSRILRTLFCSTLASFSGFSLGVSSSTLQAQSVSFVGSQTIVPLSGLSLPFGLAVDRNGNLFISDQELNKIVELPSNGDPQVTLPLGGLSSPACIAIDNSDNLYIADAGNNRVLELPPGGTQTTVGSGLWVPWALAVDNTGDLFIGDIAQYKVFEVPAGGGSQRIIYDYPPPHNGYGPYHLGSDAVGDVFVSPALIELPVGGGSPATVGPGLPHGYDVAGLAVDGAGNLLVGDDSPYQDVVMYPAGGGPAAKLTSAPVLPQEIAVDHLGNLYLSIIPLESSAYVARVRYLSQDFGSVNVCPPGGTIPAPCSETMKLTFNVNVSGTLGIPKVLTRASPNLDFTLASGSTCNGAVNAGSTCSVNLTFTPGFAGDRSGAVEVIDTSGNVLSKVFLHGVGTGPEIGFMPANETALEGPFNAPSGIAVDGAGDVFLADTKNGRVVESPAGGGAPMIVASGLGNPVAVAVDGVGNVFIADTTLTTLLEISANGGARSTVGSGLMNPSAVAANWYGNLFIADAGNNRVVEIPAAGKALVTMVSGLNAPRGIAVDWTGDLFIADTGNNRLVEEPRGGGPLITLAGGLSSPSAVSVDGTGNVFVADSGNNRVVRVSVSGGAPTLVGSGWNQPRGVAVDGAGNVLVADTGNNRAIEVHSTKLPVLSFASTPVGSTSSDSPKQMQIENIGNAALSLTGLAVGPNFLRVAGSGTPPDCTTVTLNSLAPGAKCSLSISFAPGAAGPLASAAILTDNNLNAQAPNNATQIIQLSGTGLSPSPPPVEGNRRPR